MRVLAVETSTLAGGVALLDGDVLLGQYMLDVRVTHSERLMVAVDRLLGDAGWTVRDLTGLAVAVGPGSFTGLRVGLSTVKGLALALGIPVGEWEYLALAPEALAARLGEPVIVLGAAAPAIRSPHARPAPPSHRAPSPAWVALLGVERLRGGETVAPAELVPIYLRPSEAELKRRALAVR